MVDPVGEELASQLEIVEIAGQRLQRRVRVFKPKGWNLAQEN